MESNSSISNFRKLLKLYVLPILLTLVMLLYGLDSLYTHLFVLSPNVHTLGSYKIHRSKEGQGKNEIPIFGSSRASGSYVPSLIDESCFNYGIEKTQYDLVEIMLGYELEKDKTTPIIINLDFEFFSNWVGDFAHFIPNLPKPEVREYLNNEYTILHRTPLVRYFGYFDTYNKSFLAHKVGGNVLDKGGFFLTNGFNKSSFEKDVKKRLGITAHWVSNGTKEDTFLEMLGNHQNRKFYIAIAPYHKSYMQGLENRAEANIFFDRLQSMENVNFYDFSELPYPDKYFMNTTHLNYAGAKEFSKLLRKTIFK